MRIADPGSTLPTRRTEGPSPTPARAAPPPPPRPLPQLVDGFVSGTPPRPVNLTPPPVGQYVPPPPQPARFTPPPVGQYVPPPPQPARFTQPGVSLPHQAVPARFLGDYTPPLPFVLPPVGHHHHHVGLGSPPVQWFPRPPGIFQHGGGLANWAHEARQSLLRGLGREVADLGRALERAANNPFSSMALDSPAFEVAGQKSLRAIARDAVAELGKELEELGVDMENEGGGYDFESTVGNFGRRQLFSIDESPGSQTFEEAAANK